MLDLVCSVCGTEVTDFFVMRIPPQILHHEDNGVFEQVFRPARSPLQLSERDAVVVFRKPNGELSYPARNDKPTPKGYERIVLKSFREVESFSRQNGVVHEASHFDRGSGRGFDDTFRGKCHT